MYYLKIYLGLAWKDVLRLWSATQLQIVIIAGICLPILLLLGLKRGHVADLREELVKSPTGRQIIFWTGNEKNFLSDDLIDKLETSIDGVELIIPESQRLLFFQPPSSEEAETKVSSPLGITLYSTLPGDPILEQFNVALSGEADDQLVISQGFAEASGAKPGDSISLLAKRRIGSERGEHALSFTVSGVLPTGDSGESGKIGYVSIKVMKLLEKFGRGNAIPEWSVPALESLKAIDTYEKMICVCLSEPGSLLSEKDHEFLARRGLKATEATPETLPGFYQFLQPGSLGKILVFEITQLSASDTFRSTIRDAPNFLSANTEAIDDLFLRWTDPKTFNISGRETKLIGITLPFGRETGGWIQEFIRKDVAWFDFEASVHQTNSYKIGQADAQADLTIELGNGNTIPLAAYKNPKATGDGKSSPNTNPDGNEKTETSKNPPTDQQTEKPDDPAEIPDQLTVPVTLMAYLEQIEVGETTYDPTSGKFVAVPRPIEYTKARLYTSTIDNVPGVVQSLSDREFAVLSESSRIAEIQEQDQSLQILVTVTAAGVFLFGVLTVFNVLVDSTDRKRGTIGVLRVMGTSKFGIFFMVLFRALIIGLLAAVLCTLAGLGIATFLTANFSNVDWLAWKPVISLSVHQLDLLLVAAGAILCAILGAVMPAIKASRLDPFDAIMEGRFN